MKKLLFIYNTHAGKGLLKSRLAAVLEELARDWDVTVHPTLTPPGGPGMPRSWPPAGPGSSTASSAAGGTAPSMRW